MVFSDKVFLADAAAEGSDGGRDGGPNSTSSGVPPASPPRTRQFRTLQLPPGHHSSRFSLSFDAPWWEERMWLKIQMLFFSFWWRGISRV